MKEFILADIESNLGDSEIQDLVIKFLPDFTWRSGDSDMQGRYLSGISADSATIKIWMGERPLVLSISFRSVSPNIPERESRKAAIIDLVKDQLIPALGKSIKFDC